MGEGHIKHKCGNINLNTHFTTVVSFELHKETKSKRNKFREFTQTKFPADNAQEKWGNVISLAYRTPVRPRLVGFFCLSLGIVWIPEREQNSFK